MIGRLLASPHRRYRSYVRNPKRVQSDLERLLVENIIPFWTARAVEVERYGYHLHHDASGRNRGPAPATLVPQARMLWFFSRIGRSGFGDGRHINVAEEGFRFITEHMWDSRYGGYVWEVNPRTLGPTRREKIVYGQAFALYALCEYYRLVRDARVLDTACELFKLLDQKAYDSRFGGYRDVHFEDWTEHTGPFNASFRLPVLRKSTDTHIHLLEAFAALYRLAPDHLLNSRILELVEILSRKSVVEPNHLLGNLFTLEWQPLSDNDSGAPSCGHSVESVWILIDAVEAVGMDPADMLRHGRKVFASCLQMAFDHRHGGLASTTDALLIKSGFTRNWWIQSEALLGSAVMYSHTASDVFLECFLKLLAWIVTRQADWTYGEWHPHAHVLRRPSGPKAASWKAGYHNARAVIESLQLAQSNPRFEFHVQ